MLATAATGQTLYAVLLDAAGDAWNGAAFETPSAAAWDSYALAMSEADTTGVYRASMPAVDAGVYSFLVYRQVDGSAAAGDPCVGAGSMRWTGTEEEGVSPAVLDVVLEDTLTLGEALRVMLAALAGVSTGSGTATVRFKGQDGTTDRIVATVDGKGNRLSVAVSG